MSRKAFTLAALLTVLVFRWSVGHVRLLAYNATRVWSRRAVGQGDGWSRESGWRTESRAEQILDRTPEGSSKRFTTRG